MGIKKKRAEARFIMGYQQYPRKIDNRHCVSPINQLPNIVAEVHGTMTYSAVVRGIHRRVMSVFDFIIIFRIIGFPRSTKSHYTNPFEK